MTTFSTKFISLFLFTYFFEASGAFGVQFKVMTTGLLSIHDIQARQQHAN